MATAREMRHTVARCQTLRVDKEQKADTSADQEVGKKRADGPDTYDCEPLVTQRPVVEAGSQLADGLSVLCRLHCSKLYRVTASDLKHKHSRSSLSGIPDKHDVEIPGISLMRQRLRLITRAIKHVVPAADRYIKFANIDDPADFGSPSPRLDRR